MNTWKQGLRACGVVGLLVISGTARAQSGLDADSLKLYGGLYAIDCSQPQSPRVRVDRNAISVEQGDRRLVAQSVQAAHSYFGQSPPPGYVVALLAQVQGRHEMLFVVQADARGQFLNVDGDKAVLTTLGPALSKARYRRCDAAANQRAAAQVREEQQAQAAARAPVKPGTATSPSELIRDAQFKAAYQRVLGSLSSQAWLARMDGPATELKPESVAGTTYTLAAFCKPHDCGDNNAVLLYDAPQARVYGFVHMAGRNTVVGSPPGPLMAELNRLWRREWRQGK
ncbi:MAG: Ivy family c-type lysozyme inhibitor [Pseudomonadota bacterium]